MPFPHHSRALHPEAQADYGPRVACDTTCSTACGTTCGTPCGLYDPGVRIEVRHQGQHHRRRLMCFLLVVALGLLAVVSERSRRGGITGGRWLPNLSRCYPNGGNDLREELLQGERLFQCFTPALT